MIFVAKITALVVGVLAAEMVAAVWLVNQLAEGMVR